MITIKKAKTNAGGSLLWNSVPWRGRGGPSGILLPGPSRRLAPVIKCSPFLSFFQRYIVRDVSLT